MTTSYRALLLDAWSRGERVESRHGPARELRGIQVSVDPHELVSRPGVNRALGYMELVQLLAGVFDLDAIKRVAPRADHSLFTPNMAYGPRVQPQLAAIVDALRVDRLTRQAVVFVAHPDDGPTSAQPCTSTIQFLLRDRRLEAYVGMRSWDLVKGLAYDVVMFGGLTQVVARCAGVLPGEVAVTAGSGHVYESDEAKIPEHEDYNGRHYKLEGPQFNDVNWTKQWALANLRGSWSGPVPPGIREW